MEDPKNVQNNKLLMEDNKCDKYDYLIASFCGGMAGLIDVLFVQDPNSDKLTQMGDKAADNLVERAAKFFYRQDKRPNKQKKAPVGLGGSISYLEQAFPVPYDARYTSDLADSDGLLKGMAPKNHHLLSLAHSPDPIGLVFSIIDQFTGSASFIEKGKVISLRPQKVSGATPIYELQGKDLVSKLFCGFYNWIGHILSDLAGSSSTRNNGGRGAGVPIPFYELFLTCNIGDKEKKPFADLMTSVYEEGYDARFAMAMTIPVLIEELMIKCIWVIRQKFIRKREWKDCIPNKTHADLRTMMLVGNGVLCTVDGVDALARGIAQQNVVAGLTRLNIIAWSRVTVLGVQEIKIRLGAEIAPKGDSYLESIFGKIPEDEKEKIREFAGYAKKCMELIDVKKTLMSAMKEYKEEIEKREKIEKECRAVENQMTEYRKEMYLTVENYLSEKMTLFQQGLQTMDSALLRFDSDAYISGAQTIQKTLGFESQYSSQKEFDELIDSDDDFIL